MNLMEEMKKHLPIPAYPSRELYQLLKSHGKDIKLSTELKITNVFDSGEAGGIMCSIIEENKEVYVVSLTHLKIKSSHPLFKKISKYQTDRIRELSMQNSWIRPREPK